MSERERPRRVILSAEANHFGPYGVHFRVHDIDTAAKNPLGDEFYIPLEVLSSLTTQLANAERGETERLLMDVAAGNCDHCRNVRMSNEPTGAGGRLQNEHCPKCSAPARAKIKAAMQGEGRLGG